MVVFEFPESPLAQREQENDADAEASRSMTPTPPADDSAGKTRDRQTSRQLRVVLPEETGGDGQSREPRPESSAASVEKNPASGYQERSAKTLKGLAAHSVIPHQAPQRWRVTSATVSRSVTMRIKSRRDAWKAKIRDDVNLGVPCLLHLLEPEIVFEHAKCMEPLFGRVLEGTYTRSKHFLQFYHKGGKPAYGVYEGSYRDLLAATQDLMQMLQGMAKLDNRLLDPPTLVLPEEKLPKWEDYKPRLSVVPPKPEKQELKLAAFEPPPYTPSIPFMPPDLQEVPPWMEDWQDVPEPEFKEPAGPDLPDFEPPDLNAVETPEMPRAPLKPKDTKPAYGHDWTGDRPFQTEDGEWEPLEMSPAGEYSLPPAKLTDAPVLEEGLEPQEIHLSVEPKPKLEMIWRMPAEEEEEGEGEGKGEGGLELAPGPVIWLNWDNPLEDPPPDLRTWPPPQHPENPPKPVLEYKEAQALPMEEAPELLAEPTWEEPDMTLPEWVYPLEPMPVGFMRGVAPVIIMDVSGTMNPAMRGLFTHMKECVSEILDPVHGELSAASAVFDVMTFNGTSVAWSAAYNSHQAFLEDTLTGPKTGRAQGGRIMSGRAGRRVREPGSSLQHLMPVSEEYLREAQQWVKNWPEARGSTDLIPSIEMLKEYSQCDGAYLFSDGLVGDPLRTLKHVEKWIEEAPNEVPPIHTLGFFPINAEGGNGERFLKQLALITGGSYKRYDPRVRYQYSPKGDLELYDLTQEPLAVMEERQWIEQQLRDARKDNLKLGVFERLEVTIARVQDIHREERIEAEGTRKKRERETMREEFISAQEHTRKENERIKEDTAKRFMEETRRVMKENEKSIVQDQKDHEEAVKVWEGRCEQLHQDWLENAREGLETLALREELRRQVLLRYKDEWALRKLSAGEPGTPEEMAAIQEALRVACEEVAAKQPEGKRRASAKEFCDILLRVETRNFKREREMIVDWDNQFIELEAVNKDLARRRRLRQEALQSYANDINLDFANDLVKRLILGPAKEEAIAFLEVQDHAQRRARELASIARRNRDLRIKHHLEVERRKEELRRYEAAMQAYLDSKERLEREYKEAIEKAEKEYQKLLDTAKARHDIKVQMLTDQWEQKRARLLASHQLRVQENVEFNKLKREEAKDKQKAHREAVKQNEKLMAAAQERYDKLCGVEREQHEKELEAARLEHAEECEKLTNEHEANTARQLEEWEQIAEIVEKKNEELTQLARHKYGAELDEAKEAHVENKQAAIAAFDTETIRVEKHNAIWRPRLERAAVAAKELERVMVFFEHLRACAAKMEIGVNLSAEPTPALDRVVEMSSLIMCLTKAYHDYELDQLPWPEKRWEGQRGTGWTYVPPARDLIGMTRGEIGTSIKREATMRMSARHRTAIREAAEKTARLEADPLGLRTMSEEAVKRHQAEMQAEHSETAAWRERIELGGTRRPPLAHGTAMAARRLQQPRASVDLSQGSAREASGPRSPSARSRPSTAPATRGSQRASAGVLYPPRKAVAARDAAAAASAGKRPSSGRESPQGVLSPPFSSAASSRRSSARSSRSSSARGPARVNAVSAWEVQSKLLVSEARVSARTRATGFVHTQKNAAAASLAPEFSWSAFPAVQVDLFDYHPEDWEEVARSPSPE